MPTLRIFILDIGADCPGLQVEHAMYLGILQKAEMALLMKQGSIYQPDKPLIIL